MSILGKYLHARSLIAAIANDELARSADHSHFTRIPQLTLFFARHAEIEFVITGLIEYLKVVFSIKCDCASERIAKEKKTLSQGLPS